MAFYGSKFAEAYGVIDKDTMHRVWSEELSGYTMDELNRGVNACRTLKWPPTLPEFMEHCRPTVRLSPEAAYHEAVYNMRLRDDGRHPEYSHPAVFWAAQEIGSWDMRHTPYRMLSARWERVFKMLMQSGNLDRPPPPAKALPPAKGSPPTAEWRAKLKSMSDMMKKSVADRIRESEKNDQIEGQDKGIAT